jgi:hypothetical protein
MTNMDLDEILEARETITLAFFGHTDHDVDAAEKFDEVVCYALGINQAEHPPLFLADELLLGD